MKMTPLKFLIILCAAFYILVGVVGFWVINTVSKDLPSLEELEKPDQNLATRIISADGKVLDHFFAQKRLSLPFDSIPKNFINALIAVEDRDFYNHWGVYLPRVISTAVNNIISMKIKAGASTITMQLASNLFYDKSKSFSRKLKEAVVALMIERTYTKNEILEMYANTVCYGRGAYGIQVASEIYFDKNPLQLTVSECAYLVSLLKAPEHYNGLTDYDKAIKRRNLVLTLMKEQEYINESQYREAIEEPINLIQLKQNKQQSLIAPHFVEMIRQKLSKDEDFKMYDLYRDGLVIHTTLNSSIQKYAQEAVEEHFKEFQATFQRQWSWSNNKDLLNSLVTRAIKQLPEYQSANETEKNNIENKYRKKKEFVDSIKNAATTVQTGLVVIEPRTGAILAMVGASPKFMKENRDAKYSLNHITQIKRQPGSTFKPLVYTSALQEGLTPQSSVGCGPFTYTLPSGEVWTPSGTHDCAEGETKSLTQALALSINTASARLITEVTTPAKVVALAKELGIKSKLYSVPSLSLGGGGEVTPLEMTAAFIPFANDGIYTEPFAITKVEDNYGNVLYENKKYSVKSVLKQDIVRNMTYMLRQVIEQGTAWKIKSMLTNLEAAGKTGTTNDYADAWFIGYTPQLVAGTWVGFDDRRITFTGGYGYASVAAAPLWGLLMKKIYADDKLPYKQRKFPYEYHDSTVANFDDDIENPPVEATKPDEEKEKKDYKFPKLPR